VTRSIRSGVARVVARCCNLDALIARPGRRYVMAYHRVLTAEAAAADHAHPAMWISPEALADHIRWMRSLGEIVDLDRILDTDAPNDRPLFALTFDDGWKDNYEVAFPILRSARVPATIFLVSDAIDRDRLFWPEDVVIKTHHVTHQGGALRALSALRACWPESVTCPSIPAAANLCEAWVEILKPLPEGERRERIATYLDAIGMAHEPLRGYLISWDQARDMQKSGIRFGSHTHTHRILEGLEPLAIEHELALSRRRIADELQCEVDTFCYPNARYTGTEGPLLAAAGYRYAFRIDGRRVRTPLNRYYVPRFLVSEQRVRSMDVFRVHLLEAPLFAAKAHRRDTDAQVTS
jgi:peptidoglycan/xylan/chitin deacetylase (PgdA/CDA1 family)